MKTKGSIKTILKEKPKIVKKIAIQKITRNLTNKEK